MYFTLFIRKSLSLVLDTFSLQKKKTHKGSSIYYIFGYLACPHILTNFLIHGRSLCIKGSGGSLGVVTVVWCSWLKWVLIFIENTFCISGDVYIDYIQAPEEVTVQATKHVEQNCFRSRRTRGIYSERSIHVWPYFKYCLIISSRRTTLRPTYFLLWYFVCNMLYFFFLFMQTSKIYYFYMCL